MWQIIATDTTPDGHEVELRMSESGKGRTKLRTWAMFRDGKKVGYASVERDVQPNWDRVRAGLVRNPETGHYEKPQDHE